MDRPGIAFKDQKILITGGGGYLGSRLAEKIAPSGVECFLFDRTFNAISTSLAGDFPNITLVDGDITDKAGLMRICRETAPHHIFHFAASIDRSRDFSVFSNMLKINVVGTLNLLEALADIPYKSFCFSSSSEVYGTQNPLPFREDQLPLPASPYSLTKLMAEELIRTWSGLYQKPHTIFRIFLFMGTGMPPATFIAQLHDAFVKNGEFQMTKGMQKRDYLTLNDLLECVLSLAGREDTNGEIINLCSGTSVSMKEIAEIVRTLAGNRVSISESLPYRDNEIWEIRGSNEKLKNLLPGFEPEPFLNELHKLFLI